MAIEGKVVRILNSRELIINKGSNDGVANRMKFDVLELGFDVIDPETLEGLGHLRRPKITVEIVHTEPRFAIGKTFDTYREPIQQTAMSTVLSSTYVTKVKQIREHGGFEFREDSVRVSVGDTVVQL
jgi:hypothetical protein